MRKIILSLLAIFAMVLGSGFALRAWWEQFWRGATPEETAKILVQDDKLGMRGRDQAIRYGDKIIPLIRKESKGFHQLNKRTAFWIADVLGSIHSDLSRKTLLDLHQREDRILSLVGAVGLCMQGSYPGHLDENSDLVKTVRNGEEETERELAIIALGYSGSDEALPALHDLLLAGETGVSSQDYACGALARIRSAKSIPILRRCLQDLKFSAVTEAYRAATALGDKESTALAIARIPADSSEKNPDFLIRELERVTGARPGPDKKKWEEWWAMSGQTWQIPLPPSGAKDKP